MEISIKGVILRENVEVRKVGNYSRYSAVMSCIQSLCIMQPFFIPS